MYIETDVVMSMNIMVYTVHNKLSVFSVQLSLCMTSRLIPINYPTSSLPPTCYCFKFGKLQVRINYIYFVLSVQVLL